MSKGFEHNYKEDFDRWFNELRARIEHEAKEPGEAYITIEVNRGFFGQVSFRVHRPGYEDIPETSCYKSPDSPGWPF